MGGDEKRTAEGTSDEIGCVQHRGRQGSSQAPNESKRGYRTWVDAIQSRKLILSGRFEVRGDRHSSRDNVFRRQHPISPWVSAEATVRMLLVPGGLDMPCDLRAGLAGMTLHRRQKTKQDIVQPSVGTARFLDDPVSEIEVSPTTTTRKKTMRTNRWSDGWGGSEDTDTYGSRKFLQDSERTQN